jgi:hypothetical protein
MRYIAAFGTNLNSQCAKPERTVSVPGVSAARVENVWPIVPQDNIRFPTDQRKTLVLP